MGLSERATNSRETKPECAQHARLTTCGECGSPSDGSAMCVQRMTPVSTVVGTCENAADFCTSGTTPDLEVSRAAFPRQTAVRCPPPGVKAARGQPSSSVCATLLEAVASVGRVSTVVKRRPVRCESVPTTSHQSLQLPLLSSVNHTFSVKPDTGTPESGRQLSQSQSQTMPNDFYESESTNINICLVGCVSAGKSTILNAFFAQVLCLFRGIISNYFHLD